MKYNLVACGGTFDFLHKGHRAFLDFAFSISEKVLVGITTDAFVREYKKETVHSFAERKQTLEICLREKNLFERAIIIPIDTIYGVTLDSHYPLDALVVTEETYANAGIINQEREKKGLSPLKIVTMPLLTQENQVISSSAIREGTMDIQGNAFIDPAVFSQTYHLPQHLRAALRKPFGKLIQDDFERINILDQDKIITVGDVTAKRMHGYGIQPKLSVIDFVIERKKSEQTFTDLGFTGTEAILHAINPPGVLTPQTWKTMNSLIPRLPEKKNFVIMIDGEEDLLVIPLVLLLPLGFHVFYGQPRKGLVHVEITLAAKQNMHELFKQFRKE